MLQNNVLPPPSLPSPQIQQLSRYYHKQTKMNFAASMLCANKLSTQRYRSSGKIIMFTKKVYLIRDVPKLHQSILFPFAQFIHSWKNKNKTCLKNAAHAEHEGALKWYPLDGAPQIVHCLHGDGDRVGQSMHSVKRHSVFAIYGFLLSCHLIR